MLPTATLVRRLPSECSSGLMHSKTPATLRSPASSNNWTRLFQTPRGRAAPKNTLEPSKRREGFPAPESIKKNWLRNAINWDLANSIVGHLEPPTYEGFRLFLYRMAEQVASLEARKPAHLRDRKKPSGNVDKPGAARSNFAPALAGFAPAHTPAPPASPSVMGWEPTASNVHAGGPRRRVKRVSEEEFSRRRTEGPLYALWRLEPLRSGLPVPAPVASVGPPC
ncbi:hypothetical protein ACJ73_10210 [Blastomyces percursus]|uniref:Uncharacterized protein n=1 Tax=Blastomyces percursus TaxID=1658174 RepID=A0A1J9P031_9EURO|nr:hypothetical protein ACJ73_10210 [Blastomyces percursus]